MNKDATLRFERSFAADGHRFVAGADEVGRGALAGPVSVGMVVVDTLGAKHLKGVRDSKLLAPVERELLVPRIRSWAAAWAVGHASAAEIDELGLTSALRLAGTRAWLQITAVARPDIVILDGNYNWLSPAQASLFDAVGADADSAGCDAPVRTRIKADLQCLSVAAASVLAKVERDALMAGLALEHPGYGWEVNKGYATEAHRTAILAQGACEFHRRSWRLAPVLPDGL
ncbi:ribonuclease HII [Arthrobacter sp. I2-34]|uniref:Ribonuclease n=1 Tax=Arthrobacter hankyongi TaxID=2904801 RepID=A0ABS9L6L7_9MICC|nr:ribonuclease HII [Arthrobacter hankyongi]MCG2622314.1 ribonuclease HII [Arthrobacter hankyongi]